LMTALTLGGIILGIRAGCDLANQSVGQAEIEAGVAIGLGVGANTVKSFASRPGQQG
jgi:hypothetical protein